MRPCPIVLGMKTIKITLPLLILALILMIGMGLRLRGIATTHQERAISRPLEDDSYFYFSLGRHIADGDGVMIDDRHITTGFQPLWGGIVTAVFVIVRDDSLAIGVVQLIGALAGAVACVLIYDLTRRVTKLEWGALGLSALWFWSPQSLRTQLNGMETGIATISTIAILYCTYRAYHVRSWRWHIITALVFGMAFMARIDTAVLIAPSALVLILVAPPKYKSTPIPPAPFPHYMEKGGDGIAPSPQRGEGVGGGLFIWLFHRLRVGIIMALVALVWCIPWAMLTLSLNKPLLPESGDAVRAASLYVYPDPPPQPIFTVLTENTPRFLDYYGGWTADFTRSLGSQVWAIDPFTDAPKYPQDPVDASRLSQDAYLFIGLAILTIGLALFSQDAGFRWLGVIYGVWWIGLTAAYVLVIYGIWYFARYSYPLAEVISVLAVMGVMKIISPIPTPSPIKWGKGDSIPPLHAMGRGFRGGVKFIASIWMIIILAGHINTYLNDDFYTWLIHGADSLKQDGWDVALDWLDENVPQDALVGSIFASGVIGFHAEQAVINMDGKVNREAYEALIAGRMWDYVCRSGVEYTVDWGLSTDTLLINRAPRAEWREDNMPIVAEFDTQSVASVQIRKINRQNCP
ncbi:MAG: glycosyltransferase family 39 protein [Anaerolineae bacterium]|nr:glycosyltransferase family 39 protein [Anaerolineae bacterium]